MKKVRFRGVGGELPVGKIVCVGQNYAKHVAEMNNTLPEKPLLFLKPATALVMPGEPIRLPDFSSEIHHEVELVAVLGKKARGVSAEKALECVAGYAVGIDLTARDIQSAAKKAGQPWDLAKGFDGSAPISEATSAAQVGNAQDLAIELRRNGEVLQSARTSDMIFPLPELIAYASRFFTLEAGDLFFTGTPSGVGPVQAGDVLEVAIERVGQARWEVAR